jgi:hypothetical protein
MKTFSHWNARGEFRMLEISDTCQGLDKIMRFTNIMNVSTLIK